MLANLRTYPAFFLRPVHLLRSYQRNNLLPDIVAGLTVEVILLPQAIAYALVARVKGKAVHDVGVFAGSTPALSPR